MFIVKVRWNIPSSVSIDIYKATPYNLRWWKKLVMKVHNIQCFKYYETLGTCTSASQHSFSINFPNAITKFHVKQGYAK